MKLRIPMSWNGNEGYFLTVAAFEELTEDKSDEDVAELEIKVGNYRNTIDEARTTAYDLYRFLDNAI